MPSYAGGDDGDDEDVVEGEGGDDGANGGGDEDGDEDGDDGAGVGEGDGAGGGEDDGVDVGGGAGAGGNVGVVESVDVDDGEDQRKGLGPTTSGAFTRIRLTIATAAGWDHCRSQAPNTTSLIALQPLGKFFRGYLIGLQQVTW